MNLTTVWLLTFMLQGSLALSTAPTAFARKADCLRVAKALNEKLKTSAAGCVDVLVAKKIN